jgi:hypothetical protein
MVAERAREVDLLLHQRLGLEVKMAERGDIYGLEDFKPGETYFKGISTHRSYFERRTFNLTTNKGRWFKPLGQHSTTLEWIDLARK